MSSCDNRLKSSERRPKKSKEAKNSKSVRWLDLHIGRAAEAGPKSAPKSRHRLVPCAPGRNRHAPTPFRIRVRSFTKIGAVLRRKAPPCFISLVSDNGSITLCFTYLRDFKLYSYKSFRLLRKLEDDTLQCDARNESGKAPVSCYHAHTVLGAWPLSVGQTRNQFGANIMLRR